MLDYRYLLNFIYFRQTNPVKNQGILVPCSSAMAYTLQPITHFVMGLVALLKPWRVEEKQKAKIMSTQVLGFHELHA